MSVNVHEDAREKSAEAAEALKKRVQALEALEKRVGSLERDTRDPEAR